MPLAHVNDIDLFYEVQGRGPNLALIEGIGYHTWMWYRQLPTFTPHFRTLIYDNRGVGKSDKPPGPYNHVQNADDLAGLLDHLGWERTHLLGVSMGGFIAQEFALKYPHRTEKLVLAVTAFGGPNMIPVPEETLKAMMPDPEASLEERIRRTAPYAFGNPGWLETHAGEFDQIIRWRLELPQPPEAWFAQAMAQQTFDVEARLHEITAPTLIITGTEDRVVPARNSELLAERIPHARLAIIPGAGHLVFIEAAERFNRDVLAFLQSPADAEVAPAGLPAAP